MMDHHRIHFVLNGGKIETDRSQGMILLDFIREHLHLTGTKIGCREGDCGACSVLVGEATPDGVVYHTETSCLMPLGNAHGKHIVTIEGINGEGLTPVQKAICDRGAAQCGFCTVGFVMSLTEYCLSQRPVTPADIIASMDGNICRCTGYQVLKHAARDLLGLLAQRPEEGRLDWLIANGFVPAYFAEVPAMLNELPPRTAGSSGTIWMGGGTDLNVQRPAQMETADLTFALRRPELRGIERRGDVIRIGSATTTEEIRRSGLMQSVLPDLDSFMRLISSSPIRHMATVGGNLVNASPIGDLSIMFLALNASIFLAGPEAARSLPLDAFFLGYKKLDLRPEEHVTALEFSVPGPNTRFRFEKVSKRTHLDIASVNSAAAIEVTGDCISSARLSAGGVAPIPLRLKRAESALRGQTVCAATVNAAAQEAMAEISPISDVRGSAAYKRLLLRQLLYAHFLTVFPESIGLEELL